MHPITNLGFEKGIMLLKILKDFISLMKILKN